jgi:uncharacterized protein YecE (DUF72 family)
MAAKRKHGQIRLGTASWTDKTLLESGWYPDDAKDAQSRLEFYATRFPLVEVDSTYYTPPSERNSQYWAERTPEGFLFNIKAFSLFTEHPTKVSAIYKDLRPETDKKNVYLKDLDPAVVDECWERFLAALRPLSDAGKLGAILLQFPQWFPAGPRNKEYILECRERCAPHQVCIEFRQESWMSEKNRERTIDWLRTYALPYVCVDMPQGFRSSVPAVPVATAKLAVVRFHGHSEQWESRDIYQRFGYRYSTEELREWVDPLTSLADDAEDVHVLLNNCYRDYAQTNARELAELLPGELLGR